MVSWLTAVELDVHGPSWSCAVCDFAATRAHTAVLLGGVLQLWQDPPMPSWWINTQIKKAKYANQEEEANSTPISGAVIIQEAIKALIEKPNLWARPVSWRGTGRALSYMHRLLWIVPTKRGGDTWQPYSCELLEMWEVVEPDAVLKERKPGELDKEDSMADCNTEGEQEHGQD